MTKLHATVLGLLMTTTATISGCLTSTTITPSRYYTITPTGTVEAIASSEKPLDR